METSRVTNIKKTVSPTGYKFWDFDCDGIESRVIEIGETEIDKLFHVAMKYPEGRYFQEVSIGNYMLKNEEEILMFAAEICKKAYERRLKQQND